LKSSLACCEFGRFRHCFEDKTTRKGGVGRTGLPILHTPCPPRTSTPRSSLVVPRGGSAEESGSASRSGQKGMKRKNAPRRASESRPPATCRLQYGEIVDQYATLREARRTCGKEGQPNEEVKKRKEEVNALLEAPALENSRAFPVLRYTSMCYSRWPLCTVRDWRDGGGVANFRSSKGRRASCE
jgi:hypothetical protein